MSTASFIAGDWGTTHLRLFLCDEHNQTLQTAVGPGAAAANGRFDEIWDELTGRWRDDHGRLPAVLSGMVGSSIGWMQTPYVPCPARPEQLAAACVPLKDGEVHLVPGLSCRNRCGAPDFMRGEETQLLGACHTAPALSSGRWVACLPGTHTKWALLEDGWVREFFTAPTGELFALLREHSILVRAQGAGAEIDTQAFEEGAKQFNAVPQAQLLHRLFEARGRQLSGELAPASASSWLSGLLIASDVHGALSLLQDALPTRQILVIGAPELTGLYARACALRGYATLPIDGVHASLQGLARINALLAQETV